jgi:signal transduction histidine kinase
MVQKAAAIVYSISMHTTSFALLGRAGACCSLVLGTGLVAAEPVTAGQNQFGLPSPVVTNIAQLRDLSSQEPNVKYSIRLEGNIWWASQGQRKFVLQDESGAEDLEMDLHGQGVQAGQRVRLAGNGTITRRGAGIKIGVKGPVVDNDGIHKMTEKSGTVYLSAGRHPLQLDWFNGTAKFGLQVNYEGPELPRQKIPDSALFRMQVNVADGTSNLVSGLDYRCYEGVWESLPDFNLLTPVKTGTVANVDLRGRTRDNHVGVQFTGYIELPREGLYTFHLNSDDGGILSVGEPSLQLTVLGHAALPPEPRRIAIGQMLEDGEDGLWAEVQGQVTMVREQPGGLQMELSAGASRVRVEVGDVSGLSSASLLHRWIRAVGFCQSAFTTEGERVAGVLLVPGGKEIELIETPLNRAVAGEAHTNAGALPVLTTADAVRQLRPQEAQRGYPVKIQGVVTCVQPDNQAFVIQDFTRGLYVMDSSTRRFDLPQVGEFMEIEGVTAEPGIAKAQQIKRLGAGDLPEPVHPAWDQLMNGSLDSQWVEIGGLVESLVNRSNGWWRVNLRTRAGMLKVDLRRAGVRPGPLEQYENAVVRLRGCVFADWLPNFRLKVGQIRMYNVDVMVDEPAPADLFSFPRTTAAALMRFDPAFDASHRVKVSGQIVYVRDADYFMMDGTDGLRFLAKQPLGLEAGDLVEAVGFPELSGAAPVLRGAVARKTGHAVLPKPKKLSPDDLIDPTHDSTLVRVEGLLASVRHTRTNQVLEIQAGSWRFLARLKANEEFVRSLRIGSRLELVGVYCAQGGYQALGQDVAAVDLLLNSPSDIKVLAQPSWWTLPKLLVIVGVLACVLAGMVLWITQLHRQVEKRTAEVETQIQNRQRVEHQREMEQERARIAQDLHDELGSGITEIGMLAARAKSASAPDEKRSRYLDQMGGKAREMVTALDEIVWAMNPMHDSLASLVSYFCLYADRFLGLANITWRLEGPTGSADQVVDSRHRHQLFLAFKEALTNVVRHSGATEVRLGIQVEPGKLLLSIADNGRGLPLNARIVEMDGVANMRARIEKLGGRFEMVGEAGQGTILRFHVPSK